MGLFKKREEKKEKKRESVSMEGMASSYATVYYVKLLFSKPVEVDYSAIYERLCATFGQVDKVMEDALLSSYALMDHMVMYKDDEKAPAQLLLMDVIPFEKDAIPEMSRIQCWNCENVDALLDECKYELMVSDFVAGGLPPLERYQCLSQFIDILLDVFPQCIATYWPHAEKLLPRYGYIHGSWQQPTLHFLDGGVNVRFFNINDSEDKVVDTTGLAALGLPDIQVHFHTLDHNFVIQYVFNFASYLFMNGDVIKDGDTMDGRTAQERWKCQHEDSLIGPNRVVLDICANEFAGGNRKE